MSQGVINSTAMRQGVRHQGTPTVATALPASQSMDQEAESSLALNSADKEDRFEGHPTVGEEPSVLYSLRAPATESSGLALLSTMATAMDCLSTEEKPPGAQHGTMEAPMPVDEPNPFLATGETKAHQSPSGSGNGRKPALKLPQVRRVPESPPLHIPVPKRAAPSSALMDRLQEKPPFSLPRITRRTELPETVGKDGMGEVSHSIEAHGADSERVSGGDLPAIPSLPQLFQVATSSPKSAFQPLPDSHQQALPSIKSLEDMLALLGGDEKPDHMAEGVGENNPAMAPTPATYERSDSADGVGLEQPIQAAESSGLQARLLGILAIPYVVRLFRSTKVESPQFPRQAAEQLGKASVVSLGDLHGSYLKLVETLVMADMMSMPEQVARRFMTLAKHPDNYSTDPSKLAALSKELHSLVPAMAWTGGNRKMVLIGDVIGDRGPFDQMTQSVIEHLSQDNPDRIVRIAGNHEHNVLRHMLFVPQGIDERCTPSMTRSYVIANSLPGVIELENQYGRYLRKTQLLHYEPKSKTLYVHAPIHKDNAQQLIAWLQDKSEVYGLGKVLRYEEMKTEQDMARFAAQANWAYQHYVANAAQTGFLDLKTEEMLVDGTDGHGFLWRRSRLDQEADLPFKECGVKRIVHGHDTMSQESPFALEKNPGSNYQVINLDQDVRKHDMMKILSPEAYQQFMWQNLLLLKPDSRIYIE